MTNGIQHFKVVEAIAFFFGMLGENNLKYYDKFSRDRNIECCHFKYARRINKVLLEWRRDSAKKSEKIHKIFPSIYYKYISFVCFLKILHNWHRLVEIYLATLRKQSKLDSFLTH